MGDCVIIISCTNTCNKPLSYTNVRSIYTNEERLAQLINTIKSVQIHLSNSHILVAEVSQLTERQLVTLNESKVELIQMDQDSEIATQRDSPFKGATEALVLLKLYPKWSLYVRVFKLSGRYWLNDNFNLDAINHDKYNFVSYPNNGVSTVFYSVPQRYYEEFKLNLMKILDKMKNSTECLEYNFITHIDNGHITFWPHQQKLIGVAGYVAVDKTYYQA